MTGTLGLFSLVDLFQLLASSSRTGRLGIDHPEGRARVYFDKGRVVHADFNDLVGEDAVYALFSDERGGFEFQVGLPAPEVTVEVATENLLLEAIRRLDESRRNNPQEPQAPEKEDVASDVVPVFAENIPNAGSLTLQADEVMVMRFVDGHRTLEQIAQETKIDLPKVKTVVNRLIHIGALKLRSKRVRTARLVAQLSRQPLNAGVAGIDPSILENWTRVQGSPVVQVACKRPDGKVYVFKAQAVEKAGPYMLFSRDTFLQADLTANLPLLVKPYTP